MQLQGRVKIQKGEKLITMATVFDKQLYDQATSFEMYSCQKTLDFRVRYLIFQYYREMKYHPARLDLMTKRRELLQDIFGDRLYNEIVHLIRKLCEARQRAYWIMLENVYCNNGRFESTRDVPQEMKNILFDSNLLKAFMCLGCSSNLLVRQTLLNPDKLSDLLIDARIHLDSFQLWEARIQGYTPP